MRRHPLPSGFTLLEVLIATALMAAAVGMATLGMTGLSAESRLRSAGDQLAATYSLAQTLATRTGMVVRMECWERVCRLRRLEQMDGAWTWSAGQDFSFPSGIRVSEWRPSNTDSSTLARPPSVAVAPGYVGESCEAILEGPGGLAAQVRIDGVTGGLEFTFTEYRALD